MAGILRRVQSMNFDRFVSWRMMMMMMIRPMTDKSIIVPKAGEAGWLAGLLPSCHLCFLSILDGAPESLCGNRHPADGELAKVLH